MTVRELHGRLIRRIDNGWRNVPTTSEAEGVMMLCPRCFTKNGGPVGTHPILCWSPAVSQSVSPTGGRWQLVGNTIDDLTLVAGSSSVWLAESECKAHFFVSNGAIELLPS